MKRQTIIFFFILILAKLPPAWAQNTLLKGQILSKRDNAPFTKASVYLDGYSSNAVLSDAEGKFQLSIPEELKGLEEAILRIRPTGVDFWFSHTVKLNSYPRIRLTPPPDVLLAQNLLNGDEDIDIHNPQNINNIGLDTAQPLLAKVNEAKIQPVQIDPQEAPSPIVNAEPIPNNENNFFDIASLKSLPLDSMAPTEKVKTIKLSLDNIRERLLVEKNSITEQNTDISEAIEWIANQIENKDDLSASQRLELMSKLEALESQLLANDEAYRLLHNNTQKEIDRMKEIISLDTFWGKLNFRLILGLLLVILALSALAYLFFTIARRFKKQRNELALRLDQINRQKEEIEQQRQKIEVQRDALVEKNTQLEDLQRSKEELTAMIAHDLRNPLNIILGYSNPAVTESLNKGALVDQSKYIYQASQRINVLIDNMLDVQKYARAGIHLQRQMHNIYHTAQKAIEDLYLFIEQKGLQIKNNIPEDLYSTYDFNIIERVFENLLTNAVKYTPSGGNILFSAKIYTPEHVDKSIVQISVSDTGEGIPKEKFVEIFEPFNQLNAKDFANTRSTGLGLTFCKLAVDAHESNLQVTSEIGKGTTFYFNLPKAEKIEINYQENEPEVITLQENTENVSDLSPEDKIFLYPLIEELKELELYEDSALRKVLAKVEESNSEAIKAWKIAMQEAIDSLNEAKFESLINFE